VPATGRLEVHRDKQYAVAAVSPREYRRLLDSATSSGSTRSRRPSWAPRPVLDPRYYYVDGQLQQPERALRRRLLERDHALYPGLVELFDVGNAWQAETRYNRDLLVLASQRDRPYGDIAPRPVLFLHAEVTPARFATPSWPSVTITST